MNLRKVLIFWLYLYVVFGLFCVIIGLITNSIIEAITFFSITYIGLSVLALVIILSYYFFNWLNKD